MASIAFNSRVTFDDVSTEGITHISKQIRYAKELNCVIKLLACGKKYRDRNRSDGTAYAGSGKSSAGYGK